MPQFPHKPVLARGRSRLGPRRSVDVKSPAASQIPARIHLPNDTAEAIKHIPTYGSGDVVSPVHPVEVGRCGGECPVDRVPFLDGVVPVQQVVCRRAINRALPSQAVTAVYRADRVPVVGALDQAILQPRVRVQTREDPSDLTGGALHPVLLPVLATPPFAWPASPPAMAVAGPTVVRQILSGR